MVLIHGDFALEIFDTSLVSFHDYLDFTYIVLDSFDIRSLNNRNGSVLRNGHDFDKFLHTMGSE